MYLSQAFCENNQRNDLVGGRTINPNSIIAHSQFAVVMEDELILLCVCVSVNVFVPIYCVRYAKYTSEALTSYNAFSLFILMSSGKILLKNNARLMRAQICVWVFGCLD